MKFKDRCDAGQKLVEKLSVYKGKSNIVVLGLPRGGVVVAEPIAQKLELPLDILVTRKIGFPDNQECALGAIDENGVGVWDEEGIEKYSVSRDYIDIKTEVEKYEARRRLRVYRGNRPALDLKNKIVLLVDDGIATGHTMLAAIASARNKGAKKIVVVVPISAPDSLQKVRDQADEVICLDAPFFFGWVGKFYRDFSETVDEEVMEILKRNSLNLNAYRNENAVK